MTSLKYFRNADLPKYNLPFENKRVPVWFSERFFEQLAEAQ